MRTALAAAVLAGLSLSAFLLRREPADVSRRPFPPRAESASTEPSPPEGERPSAHAPAALIATEPDEVLRGQAIQAFANAASPPPDGDLRALGLLARADPVPRNRLLAALALGGASDAQREEAVGMLRAAHAAEPLPEVRRLLLIHVVRAAGAARAPEELRRMGAADPAVSRDVADYLEILASGATDPDAIYGEKFRRDATRGTVPGPLGGVHQD